MAMNDHATGLQENSRACRHTFAAMPSSRHSAALTLCCHLMLQLVTLVLQFQHGSSIVSQLPPAKCRTVMQDFCNGARMYACISVIKSDGGLTPLEALYDTDSRLESQAWRCYSPSALTNTTINGTTALVYNRALKSKLYCSEDAALSNILNVCEGKSAATRLVLLEKAAMEDGAVCLDGSPPAVYIRQGAESTKWHIYLEGGGWCYHDPPLLPEDNQCYYRAYGPSIESNTPPAYLGSSRMLQANYSDAPPRGFSYFQSDNPAQNPGMHNWSFAYVHYCDGASYTGNRDSPVMIQGKPVFYRGRRVLDAVLAHLLEHENVTRATDVVVSGSSAGGLGVYVNIDHITKILHTANPTAKIRGLASTVPSLSIAPPPKLLEVAPLVCSFVYSILSRHVEHVVPASFSISERIFHHKFYHSHRVKIRLLH
eukprot:m.324388 g.324388  ORF g.324388 m.324388 type:complete len:427 (-) comp20373_c0_seq9:1268-2548(-)